MIFQICHAVAAAASPDGGAWPELLPAVVFAAQVINGAYFIILLCTAVVQ